MSHRPRPRTVVSCTLLVVALGRGRDRLRRRRQPALRRAVRRDGPDLLQRPAGDGKKADPDKPLEVTAKGDDGRITDVTAVDAAGRYLAGELTADGSRWHSTAPLAAGAHYTVRVSTEDGDGAPGRRTLAFDTSPPTPRSGWGSPSARSAGTYGVGQPVTAELSRPVKDAPQRAIVERALKVDSTPARGGRLALGGRQGRCTTARRSTGPPTPRSRSAAT